MTKYAALCLAILVLSACSTTWQIPDDDQLFIGLKSIDYENYETHDQLHKDHFITTQEEIEAALATAPNAALFGSSYYRSPLPIGLWIWNWANGSSGKIKQWMNKSFGTPPVLMSQVNPALRASVAKSVLRKNGYLHSNVTYKEVPQKNKKKMKLAYTVNLDTLFMVSSMEYKKFPDDMQQLIDSTVSDAKLHAGSPFSVGTLDDERSRISMLMRNNGYYLFSPSYTTYLADTFELPYRAQLRLQLADSLDHQLLQKWYMGRTSISLRRTAREQLTDSAGRSFLKVYYSGKKPPLRPRVILRNMKLIPRRAYSYDNYVESVQNLNATGIFSSTDFQFTPRPGTDTLDLAINCVFDKPYDFYFETNMSKRTIGRMGPETRIGMTIRNAFRGGEKIDVNVHGSYEWETASGSGADMNSYQYGADGSIEFPRLLIPFLGRERIRRTKDGRLKRPIRYFATPTTIAKASTDIIYRPNYYKMHIVSGEWTYRIQLTERSRHEFSPLTLKYQFMNSHTQAFDDIISQNPYLTTTMSDYFIPKMRYTYTYASPKGNIHPYLWVTTVEEAGNVSSLYFLAKGQEWNEKDKKMFKNPYSQFVKLETDYTKTWPFDSKSKLVAHANFGIMWTYGNSSSYPFSEGFYVGGANSIRAFSVRSIGPGAFPGTGNRQESYMMQNGDVKLVMNLEYRRQLFGSLYGALFLDAGNVWNRRDMTLSKEELASESTPEWMREYGDSQFKLGHLIKQMATGTGLGLRYDLDFLVLRVDWGFGLHVPYKTSKSGYFNIERFKDMHTLHIAIGYPF
jgi:hypothetical protein